MNPTADPPQPPQPHRPSTSCDRHPDERFTGFCPSCLCERLSVLDQNNNSNNNNSSSSSSRKPPISAAALKAIFKPSSSTKEANNTNNEGNSGRVRGGLFPELRRTKSFSASKNNNEGFSGVLFEPQRRSCDVRVRNTLWSLFGNQEEQQRNVQNKESEIDVEPRKSSVREPVLESKEEEKTESESDGDNCGFEIADGNSDIIQEVERVEEEEEEEGDEIVEEQPDGVLEEEDSNLKPMKDHIDLDSQAKRPSRDFKEIAGSFWSAASVFSKKLQKWRQKQKLKKQRRSGAGGGGGYSARLPVEKPIGRQLRDTQSEIADYGYGRRSCDTDPRFSLDAGRFSLDAGRFSVDAGRFSVDDPRYSFDEPRASWDGYLIGRPAFPAQRIPPSMLSVVEDAPARHVARSDTQIPVEEPPPPSAAAAENETAIPGGSSQTRDYYTDSSSRRRKSLDRSSSVRKTAAAVVAEMDETKPVSNAKVSPATTTDYIQSHPNSLKDDCSVETFEHFRDNASVIGNGERKMNSNKKSRRWSKWNILGFIHRKNLSKFEEEDDDRFSRSNGVVERSFSESWPELRGGERNGGLNNPKLLRSNSNVSWRNSSSGFGFGGAAMRSNGNGGMLERNRSTRHSPKDGENGMLRLYLTPMGGSRRGGGVGWEKTAARASSHGHSIARSMMRLY